MANSKAKAEQKAKAEEARAKADQAKADHAKAKAEHEKLPEPEKVKAKADLEKAETEAQKAEAAALAEYNALPEAERLRLDLARVDAEIEDSMHPDSKQKKRDLITARLREIYEPIVPPLDPAEAPAMAEREPEPAAGRHR